MENILFKLHDWLAFVHSFMFSMNFVYFENIYIETFSRFGFRESEPDKVRNVVSWRSSISSSFRRCSLSCLQIQTFSWGRLSWEQWWDIISTETTLNFSFSVHLLHAWILCAYQGEDDVLQLQERGGGGAGEVAQHTAGEEGGDRLRFRAHPGVSSVRAASSAEPQQA